LFARKSVAICATPNYRFWFVPGATYLFTANLANRGIDLPVCDIDRLRAAWAKTQKLRPFMTQACVGLPDHMHGIWTLSPDDCDFPGRWRALKTFFEDFLFRGDRSGSGSRAGAAPERTRHLAAALLGTCHSRWARLRHAYRLYSR